jgi:MtN3 and saliva related transmembrane protein
MSLTDALGGVAAVVSTSAFFPQALRVIATRDTHAISLGMYALIVAGIVLWGAYGVLTQQWPIIVANIVTFCPAIIILVMKIRHVQQDKADRRPD